MQELLINVGSAIVLALVAWGFKLLRSFILQKVDNARVQDALLQSTDIIETVVLEMEQTIVSTLKKEGRFTKEAQQEVLSEARNKIIRLLPKQAKRVILALYDDLELWLTEKIESTVNKNKTMHRASVEKGNKAIKDIQE